MIPGQINVIFGWAWMCVGLILGLILGLRAERDQWLGGYDSLTRRYLRLGHIAFIALSIINILYGKELGSTDIPPYVITAGSPLLIFGAAGVPVTCVIAAFFRKAKYFLPLPAISLLVGIGILVIGFMT
ncbi:MAG: hypothetical protein Q7R50_00580 [Dehalococcoidales bacterium]|nr:hypothetical protein [Dehalococcoidales bacterium]